MSAFAENSLFAVRRNVIKMAAAMKIFLFFILGYYVLLAKGFLPSQESTDGRPDYTHASITQAAIYQATADVIANVIDPTNYNASDPDGTIQKYFSNLIFVQQKWKKKHPC